MVPDTGPVSVERRASASATYSSRFRLYVAPGRVVSIGTNPATAAMVVVEVVVVVSVSVDVKVVVMVVVPAVWVSVIVVEAVMVAVSCRGMGKRDPGGCSPVLDDVISSLDPPMGKNRDKQRREDGQVPEIHHGVKYEVQ
jgi:hypothetical protein